MENTTSQSGPEQGTNIASTTVPPNSDLNARVIHLEKMLSNLEQMGNAFNTQVLTMIQQQEEDLYKLQLHEHSEVSPSNEIQAAGFTFKIQSTPKQDVFIGGVNKVGREGAVVLLNDGTRDFSIAKIEWDHVREVFTLSVGKGVN
jgi:DUF971 family protein